MRPRREIGENWVLSASRKTLRHISPPAEPHPGARNIFRLPGSIGFKHLAQRNLSLLLLTSSSPSLSLLLSGFIGVTLQSRAPREKLHLLEQ